MDNHNDENNSKKSDFEYIYSVIKEVSLKYINDNDSNFRGLSEEIIEELENQYDRKFPEAYRSFLKTMAARLPKIFDCQLYNKEGIENAQEVAAELLEQDRASLPEGAFAFSQWQGYQFYYFVDDGTANPETFYYREGGDQKPHTIAYYGCFTDWLINLSIYNMQIFQRLNGYEIDEGVKILQGLLKQKGSK